MLNKWYGILPNIILYAKDLSDKQKLLFVLISSLCAEKWFCRASNKYISEKLWCNETRISKQISDMSKKWYIKVDVDKANWNTRAIVLQNKSYCPTEQDPSCPTEQYINTIPIITKDKENKKAFWEKQKVYLSEEEYKKLKNLYPLKIIEDKILWLENYIVNLKGAKYKDHYLTILNRLRRDNIKDKLPETDEEWVEVFYNDKKEWKLINHYQEQLGEERFAIIRAKRKDKIRKEGWMII